METCVWEVIGENSSMTINRRACALPSVELGKVRLPPAWRTALVRPKHQPGSRRHCAPTKGGCTTDTAARKVSTAKENPKQRGLQEDREELPSVIATCQWEPQRHIWQPASLFLRITHTRSRADNTGTQAWEQTTEIRERMCVSEWKAT